MKNSFCMFSARGKVLFQGQNKTWGRTFKENEDGDLATPRRHAKGILQIHWKLRELSYEGGEGLCNSEIGDRTHIHQTLTHPTQRNGIGVNEYSIDLQQHIPWLEIKKQIIQI